MITVKLVLTGKETYDSEYSTVSKYDALEAMIEFAKMHVKACKKEISENYLYYLEGDEGSEKLNNKKFNKEVYSLENIK